MKGSKKSEWVLDEYLRIRQILKVEHRLSVQRLSALCPDLSIDQVDYLIIELERRGLVQVERQWEGFFLKREDFYINDTSDF